MAPAQGFVVDQQGPVLRVTLDAPGVKNALTIASYEGLRDLFTSLKTRDDVAAIVLTGQGDDFCSGGHVEKIIGNLVKATGEELHAFNRLTGECVAAMRALDKPIVAAIDGIAAGGGAALALACDLRVASDRARIAFLFNRVGLSAADMGVTWLLPRLVGLGRATEILFFGKDVGAQEAQAIGLVNRLCPPDALQAAAMQWARSLADQPRFALGQSKQSIEAVAPLGFAEALVLEAAAQTHCMQHEDFQEGYRAFGEKRRPRFNS